jgi:hypothetical protein
MLNRIVPTGNSSNQYRRDRDRRHKCDEQKMLYFELKRVHEFTV